MHRTTTLGMAFCAMCSSLPAAPATAAQATDQLAAPHQASSTASKPKRPRSGPHLAGDATIGAMLHHPAFAGFGRLLLPWNERRVDEALPLAQVGTLLPYHSHVQPATVLSALNHMIDDADAGKTIFYPLYSQAQIKADPELAHTGLFFLRGKPGAPFAVVAPGGGFQYVGSLHEGFPYAAAIARSGYNAFVLRYRVGSGGAKASADLAAALSHIVAHAGALGVATDGYSLWGSSAGARMAAAIGTHGAARFGGADLPKPAAVVMAYTGHDEIGPVEPPTFVVVGEHDGIAPPAAMRRRVDALRRIGTPVEFHVYPGLGHGFGLGAGTSAEGWVDQAIRFWAGTSPSGLCENLFGNRDRRHGVRPTGIERQVRDGFDHFGLGHAILARDPQVRAQLVGTIHRHQGADRDKAAVALGKLLAFPHVAIENPVGQVGKLRGDAAVHALRRRLRAGSRRSGGLCRCCRSQGAGRKRGQRTCHHQCADEVVVREDVHGSFQKNECGCPAGPGLCDAIGPPRISAGTARR